jgi:hypothetical protein
MAKTGTVFVNAFGSNLTLNSSPDSQYFITGNGTFVPTIPSALNNTKATITYYGTDNVTLDIKPESYIGDSSFKFVLAAPDGGPNDTIIEGSCNLPGKTSLQFGTISLSFWARSLAD